MSRLTPKEFIRHAEGKKPLVGLDIAVNMKKGLRFVSRLPKGICELTLRFKPTIRISREWPFLDLPVPQGGSFCSQEVLDLFRLNDEEAAVVSQSFSNAECLAVDAPCSFGKGQRRRDSELAWHRLEIPSSNDDKPLKKGNGGVLWSPLESEITEAIHSYFDPEASRKPTTQQLIMLSQSLWIFVGLWMYKILESLGTDTIEVYPHASRVICQEISSTAKGRESLVERLSTWSTAFSFDDFISRKSETNDAAIGCFTAFLHAKQLTEELAPDEIVIPRRPANGGWAISSKLVQEV